MATEIHRLTPAFVRKTSKPGKHHDGGGLYLIVTPSRTAKGQINKSWMFRFRGREKGLGSLKTVSLAEAREAARKARQQVLQGDDPIDAGKAAKAAQRVAEAKAVTWDELFIRFMAAHESGWSRRHRQQWANTNRDYVSAVIGKLPVGAIDVGLAMQVLEPHWRRVPTTMQRVRGRCELVWDSGEVQGLCSGKNPFAWRGLRHLLPLPSRIHKVEHHAAVPWAEVPALMAKLRAIGGLSALTLEFVILTAARVGEVTGARGHEFDLASGRWRIPSHRMKGRREHTVMLSSQAVAILSELHPDGLPDDGRVFPIGVDAVARAMARAGYDGYTAHGTARASFKTWADECTAFKNAVSEACLSHIESDRVRSAYARGTFEQWRVELMEAWAMHCASPPEAEKVVALAG